MLALEPDVRVIAPLPGWQPGSQLRINSGVRIARETQWSAVRATYLRHHQAAQDQLAAGLAIPPRRSPGFLAAREVGGVYPPKDNWRPLTNEEQQTIVGVTDETDLHSTVQVLAVPRSLIRTVRERIAPFVAAPNYDFDPGLMMVAADHLGDLVARMNEWLAADVLSVPSWSMVSVRIGEPGRVISSGFQGLHIDLYGPLVQEQLASRYAGSRLVVNLTDETRYVAFINLRLATMLSRYPQLRQLPQLMDAIDASMGATQSQGIVANAFMESFPEYPVIRLAVEPGQAYIAPTTAIPHEGLLGGSTAPDLLLLAGHKGETDGVQWTPPDYVPEWQRQCRNAVHRLLAHS
ncbi:MAG: hypothetical protein WDO56_09485 [Gammaproteobacteria bacterium]